MFILVNEIKLSIWKIIITLSIVITIIVLYAVYFDVNPVILLSINPLVLVSAITIYTLSWLISSIRLKIIHSSINNKALSLLDYFYARLLGGLVAYLTPSAMGGEPARAYYLSKKSGCDMATGLAIAIYELFIDIVFINVLAIIYSIYYLPISLPVILVSVFVLFTWTTLFIGVIYKNRIVDKLFKFIIRIFPENIRGKYSIFTDSIRLITRFIIKPYKIMIIIFSTVAMHLFAGVVIYIISIGYGGTSILNAFQAYLFALALGALPSPGGAFAIEYGLTITLKPIIVVTSRVLMYFYTVIMGLYALAKTRD